MNEGIVKERFAVATYQVAVSAKWELILRQILLISGLVKRVKTRAQGDRDPIVEASDTVESAEVMVERCTGGRAG